MVLTLHRSEPPALQAVTSSERRKFKRSTPLLTTETHLVEPQPPTKSQLALHGLTYPDWKEPHLTKTPWELQRHKRHKHKKPSLSQRPTKLLKNLPREVYECIVTQLEHVHLGQSACSACYLGELHSLSLVSRASYKATTLGM
jgi:hypothetical protein